MYLPAELTTSAMAKEAYHRFGSSRMCTSDVAMIVHVNAALKEALHAVSCLVAMGSRIRGCAAAHLGVELDVGQEEVDGVKDFTAALPHAVEAEPARGDLALIAPRRAGRLLRLLPAVALHAPPISPIRPTICPNVLRVPLATHDFSK